MYCTKYRIIAINRLLTLNIRWDSIRIMTLPRERNWAIHNTREFLRSLLDPKKTPRIPSKVRREAYWCLKHYPNDWEIEQVADNKIFEKKGKE